MIRQAHVVHAHCNLTSTATRDCPAEERGPRTERESDSDTPTVHKHTLLHTPPTHTRTTCDCGGPRGQPGLKRWPTPPVRSANLIVYQCLGRHRTGSLLAFCFCGPAPSFTSSDDEGWFGLSAQGMVDGVVSLNGIADMRGYSNYSVQRCLSAASPLPFVPKALLFWCAFT